MHLVAIAIYWNKWMRITHFMVCHICTHTHTQITEGFQTQGTAPSFRDVGSRVPDGVYRSQSTCGHYIHHWLAWVAHSQLRRCI